MTQSYNPTMYPPLEPKKKWWKNPLVWAPALALVVGLGVGSAGQPEAKTVEVIKEVPGPERVVTKTERVEVPVTPEACITALDLNEQAFSGLSESLGHVSEQDYAAAKASNDRVSKLVPKVNAAKLECRASK